MEKVFVVFAQQRKRNFLTAQLFLQVVLQQKTTIRTEYPGRLRRRNQIIRRNRAEKYPGIIKKQF